MTDYGIELAVGDDEGPRVCIPAGKLSAVQVCLRRAPGGADLALTRAAEKIELALARPDEVGHFVLADEEATALVWAIDAMSAAEYPIGYELRQLRAVLTQRESRALDVS
jgi:hypothetical protein